MSSSRSRMCRRAIAVAAAVGTLAFLATAPGLPTSADARPLRTGVFDSEAYFAGNPVAGKRTRGAGAGLAKVTLSWSGIATREPVLPANPADPAYDWEHVDRFVRQADAAGLQPILLILDTPAWARADPGCRATTSCAPDPGRLGAFAKAAATRYSGLLATLPRVRYWQAWSEPNLDFFMVPTSPSHYRAMLAKFSAGVKDVHASNLVIGGGLAPLERPGSAVGPLEFMRKLLCMKGRASPRPACGKRARLDIWSTHPYTTGGPTHAAAGRDDVSLGDLPEMTRLLRAADRFGKIRNSRGRTPFWVTEFSWDSKPPDPGGVPSARHTRWVAEALYRMWKAEVSAVVWFLLRDEARRRPWAATYQSGLYYRGSSMGRDRPKPALRAFRFPFVALPAKGGKTTVWGRTPTSRPGKVVLQARFRRGGWRNAGRARARGGGVFAKTLGRRPLEMRAVFAGRGSVPFAVRRTRDVYQPPFGGNPRAATRAASPRLRPGAEPLYRALTEAAR